MSVITIPFLFDRPLQGSHAWKQGMSDMAESTDWEDLALHSNLSMDHRITTTDEPALVNDVMYHTNAVSPSHLRSGLQSCFKERYIRPSSQIHFLGSSVALPGHTELLHVTSLKALFKRLSNKPKLVLALREIFDSFVGNAQLIPENPAQWESDIKIAMNVATALNQISNANFIDMMEEIHSLLPANAPCWWTTPALELGSLTKNLSQGEDMLYALGLGDYAAHDYLLVYRYKIRDVGILFQPTTVESNAYRYHFPSPPSTALKGGITMPLQPWVSPCTEYLHHPLNAEKASQTLQRPLLSLSKLVSADSIHQRLDNLRISHRNTLQRDAGKSPPTIDWVNKHQHLF